MAKLDGLHLQYVTDREGQRVAVLLPVEEFEELMETIYDLAAIAERREERTMAHEDVLAQLKRDGFSLSS